MKLAFEIFKVSFLDTVKQTNPQTFRICPLNLSQSLDLF